METYTKEQMLEVGRRFHEMKDLTKKEADEVILEFISTLPVSSEKDIEREECDNCDKLFDTKILKGMNTDPGVLLCPSCHEKYPAFIPSNRIGVEELREKFFKYCIDENIEIDSDIHISNRIFDFFLPHLSVSDEVKKPIEEITDEDAVEVSIIFYDGQSLDKRLHADRGRRILKSGKESFKLFQYLQSKNYQLPKYY